MWELVQLLASRALSIASKARLYQARVESIMLYASETLSLKEEYLAKIERKNASSFVHFERMDDINWIIYYRRCPVD